MAHPNPPPGHQTSSPSPSPSPSSSTTLLISTSTSASTSKSTPTPTSSSSSSKQPPSRLATHNPTPRGRSRSRSRSRSSLQYPSSIIIINDHLHDQEQVHHHINLPNQPSRPFKLIPLFIPSCRKLNWLILSLISILFCLSSLTLIAIHRGITIPTPKSPIISLNLIDHHQLKSSAQHLSSHLINWFDSVPDRLSPLLPSSIYHRLQSNYSPSSSFGPDPPNPQPPPHPILPLLLNSRLSWKSILRSQPTSLQRARRDYKKSFHPLLPPPGFDQWFQFARDRNFTLINRFDGLMADLEPFRKLTPHEIIRRTEELVRIPGITHLRITPQSIVEIDSPSGRVAPGHTLKRIIERIISQSDFKLPPIDLAINEHTEARVLPRQTRPLTGKEFYFLEDSLRKQYEQQDPERKPSLDGFKSEWGKDGNVWDAYRRACPPDSSARRLVETVRSAESLTGAVAAGGGLSSMSSTQTHLSLNRPTRLRALHPIGTAPLPSPRELTFLSELESTASFCERPSTHHLHSAFFADQRSIEHLYPLFSPSKPQGFSDILIPSYYHYSPTAEYVYESDLRTGLNSTPTDPIWKDKVNKMYWRGKLTRGANTPPGHTSSFQKQRLVKLVSNDTESTASLTSNAHKQGETDPSWRSETSRVLVSLNVTSDSLLSVSAPATVVDPLLLDIAMACDPEAGECHELNQRGYHTQPPAPMSEAWRAKMTLDLDDSGFSPSFGALMESRSAVVKMSIHQEFWRDWIQPWYHFIPLSSSYAELHNLITFFLGVPDKLKEQMLPIKKQSHQIDKSNRNQHKLTKRSEITEKREEGRRESIKGSNQGGIDSEAPGHHGFEISDEGVGLDGFDGDEELRMIGENGRDWKLRHLRQEDMEVYIFRLLIEWARILYPDSTSSSSTNHT